MAYSMTIRLKDILDILFTCFLVGALIYEGFMLRKAKRALDSCDKLRDSFKQVEEGYKELNSIHGSGSKIEQALGQRGQKLNSIQKTVLDLGVKHLKKINTQLDKLETESGISSMDDIGPDHWRAKNSRYN